MSKTPPTPERAALVNRWLAVLDRHAQETEARASQLEKSAVVAGVSQVLNALNAGRSLDYVRLGDLREVDALRHRLVVVRQARTKLVEELALVESVVV